MDAQQNLKWLTLALLAMPFAGFLLSAFLGRQLFKTTTGALCSLLLGIAFCLSLTIAYYFYSATGSQGQAAMELLKIKWLYFTPTLQITMGLLLDSLTVMMLVVVTFISLLVHVYSISYLKGEERYSTYFAYLSLFTFAMLGLVVAVNIFQLYIFWELVGVSSFLLIGFYFQKPSAVAACKKAFIVTRFADLGLLLGILILSYHGGSMDFLALISHLTQPGLPALQQAQALSFMGVSALSWGLCLVFVGGAGKSALLPLHIWLPDAMEGPTPVSALIHAATMVVAGVFLVARLFPVYALSAPGVLHGIAWVGAITSLFAATIACTQTDIKRVLAYSTMSQIGMMIMALGVSGYGSEAGLGYTASLFHLFTHAIFKALLFLAAGVIIHFVHHNSFVAMGSLRKLMPVTHACFLIACLAIAGVPPFAGFFSKEEILLAAWQQQPILYYASLFTATLTAFYMFRLYFNIFWHKPFGAHPAAQHHHHPDGNWLLKTPLLLLAGCSIVAGFIHFGKYVSTDGLPLHTSLHLGFAIAPVLLSVLGIATAALLYYKQNDRPKKIAAATAMLYKAAQQKFYVDEGYLFVTKRILMGTLGKGAAWLDKYVVDGAVNKVATGTQGISAAIKNIQSGSLQQYALYFLLGLLLIVIWLTVII
jgi:NADH-quinone oxidoreductase subunit L